MVYIFGYVFYNLHSGENIMLLEFATIDVKLIIHFMHKIAYTRDNATLY
jgi:hypothetical protein